MYHSQIKFTSVKNSQPNPKSSNMAFKFVFALAFVAVASAGYVPEAYHAAAPVHTYGAPVAVAQKVLVKSDEEYDPHPQYRFSYGVDDKLTGDSKGQVEERDGDVVRGEYSLIDADGYKRTVTYTADSINGFNAVVNREPLHVVKTVAAAPVAHYAAPAPVAHYAAPTVVKTVAAPVAHYAAPAVHYSAPTVVKTVAPVAHYAAPAVVKTVAAPAYSTYAAPAHVAHYAAPAHVAHYAAPATHYAAPAAHYATYSAPAVSYHH